MKSNNVSIIIPAYEPDENLIKIVADLKTNGFESIVIVDDGSGEKYKSIFSTVKNEYGCELIIHNVNMGKGRALKDAFNYVLNKNESIIGVITADSDGQHSCDSINKVYKGLMSNPDSLILGVRNFDGKDIPFKSVFGNKLTRFICRYLCGLNISDTQTGLRGIPKEAMRQFLTTKGERFEFETYMLIETKEFCEIKEVEIETIYDSKENHVTHFDPLRDSIRIYTIFGRIFTKYLFSSLSSFVLDIMIFSICCKMFKSWNPVYYVTAATVVGRVVSATYNYLINYTFVFNSKKSKKRSLVSYVALAAVQMVVSAGIVTFLVYLFNTAAETGIKIAVDTVLFFVSYYIQRRVVF